MSVMSSPRNRCRLGVDNPIDDDGFWEFRKFKANRKGGGPTGGRLWRRTIRTREQRLVRAEIDQYYADLEEERHEALLEEIWEVNEPLAYMGEAYWPANQEESIFTSWPDEDDFVGCNDDCPSCLAADDELTDLDRMLFGWDG